MVDAIKFDGKLCESMKAINELALRNGRELVEIQTKAVKNLFDVSLAAGREAFEVKGREDVRAYFNRRMDAGRQVLETAAGDAQAIVKMSQETAAEVARIYQPAAV